MTGEIGLFVPGRLCLFGEHSDWAGLQRVINADIVAGRAIVTGIEQGIYARAKKADKFIMRNTSEELRAVWTDFECPMQKEPLKKTAASGDFFSYAAGVASYVNEHYYVGGLEITITGMSLPMKSGLSSSAAICVLVARAFNIAYELNMNTAGEMNAAFKGEQRTMSRCGRLDQACAFGVGPVFMTFDGEDIEARRVPVRQPLHWVFADLKAGKDTVKILSDLNRCYPFPSSELERNVHEALGGENMAVVERAAELIASGDAESLGRLMTEAQKLFDSKVAPASIEQLRAPKLHAVLTDRMILPLTYGGKGVGSQGDGSVQFLAKSPEAQQELTRYLTSIGLDAYTLTLSARRQIRKAVIPLAGYGTRLYPATRLIKKEFLPVTDSDGFVKPVVLILLEQLYDSGLEEICLVVSNQEDLDYYRRYFTEPLQAEHLNKLTPSMRRYEEKIQRIGAALRFRIPNERLGFGYSVYQTRDFCEDEPALLLLGDTLYKSGTAQTCMEQMIEAYETINQPMVSIHAVPLEQVDRYGILAGAWEDDEETVMRVRRFVEKPSKEYARDYLCTPTKARRENYYSVFGQYVITPEVFAALEDDIAQGKTQNGEYQLTGALSAMIGTAGLKAVRLKGRMFDAGTAELYKCMA
ncbi:MAG: hypothetical protein LBS62_11990 [Clostridiales bacterium]|nr:hypothetical protein [Clostridiales bacterium]